MTERLRITLAQLDPVVGDLAGESVPESDESHPPSPYKYCLSCGKGLDRAIPAGERPVCSTCESLGEQGRRGLVDEVLGVPPTLSSGSRKWLYGLILMLLIVAAVMGYRFANADNAEHGAVPEMAESPVVTGPAVLKLVRNVTCQIDKTILGMAPATGFGRG